MIMMMQEEQEERKKATENEITIVIMINILVKEETKAMRERKRTGKSFCFKKASSPLLNQSFCHHSKPSTHTVSSFFEGSPRRGLFLLCRPEDP